MKDISFSDPATVIAEINFSTAEKFGRGIWRLRMSLGEQEEIFKNIRGIIKNRDSLFTFPDVIKWWLIFLKNDIKKIP